MSKYFNFKLFLFILLSLFLFPNYTYALQLVTGNFTNYHGSWTSATNNIMSFSNNVNVSFDGTFIFNTQFSWHAQSTTNYLPTQVVIRGNFGASVCDIGNIQGYTDNETQNYSLTVTCPVANGFKITSIDMYVLPDANVNMNVYLGVYYSIVGSNNGDIVSAIVSQTESINNNNDTNTNSINTNIHNFDTNVHTYFENARDSINGRIDAFRYEYQGGVSSINSNNNSNTDRIIDAIEDSNTTCKFVDKSYSSVSNKYLNANGQERDTTGYNISDYININGVSIFITDTFDLSVYSCFYTHDKELISCTKEDTTNMPINSYLTKPDNAYYFRYTINNSRNVPTFKLCTNSNNSVANALDDFASSDLSEDDKSQPSDEDYQDYHAKEEELFDYMDYADMSNLDIAINSSSSNWIWDTMQRLFNSNSNIFTWVLSILSIGIIKLGLAR